MAAHKYIVLFEPAEEGGYVALCPALPGLVTEAIEGYLKSLQKDGEPIVHHA